MANLGELRIQVNHDPELQKEIKELGLEQFLAKRGIAMKDVGFMETELTDFELELISGGKRITNISAR